MRVSFEPAANNTITLTQEDYYYPFGLRVPIVDQAANKNRYLYNGKELVEFEGLNWYDYGLPPEKGGAHWYGPQLGRWHVVDPLHFNSPHYSPYNYCFDDSINMIDPEGMYPWNEKGWYFEFGIGWLYRPKPDYQLNSTVSTITSTFWLNTARMEIGVKEWLPKGMKL